MSTTTRPTVDSSSSAARLRTGPLTERVRRRDVRRFWRSWRIAHPSTARTVDRVRRVVILLAAWVVGPVGILALGTGLVEGFQDGTWDDREQLRGFLVFASVFFFAEGVFVWFLVRTRRRRATPERTYRLVRFAHANGLSFELGPVPASHLGPWRDRQLLVRNVLRTTSGRPVEFGDHELVPHSSNSRQASYGGYAAVRLGVPLPHVVLLARRNAASRRFSPVLLPDGDQRLGLEGDFDEHFELLCPAGSERDALYLFTPDVMARLIDDVGAFDVELVEDHVFLTVPGDLVTLDPERWRAVLDAVDAVTEKLDRWERWRADDEDAAPGPRRAGDGPEVRRVVGRAPRLRYRPGLGLVLLVGGVLAWFVIGFWPL